MDEDLNGYVIIKILSNAVFLDKVITKDEHQEKYQLKSFNNAKNYLYAVKKEDFGASGRVLLSSKIIGTTILHPFKLRPSKGIKGTTFNNDISISYNFGFRVRMSNNIFSKNYLSIIIYGVGIYWFF